MFVKHLLAGSSPADPTKFASWPSIQAAVCKTQYAGEIPVDASNHPGCKSVVRQPSLELGSRTFESCLPDQLMPYSIVFCAVD